MAPSARPVSQTGMTGFTLQWALSLDWETMTGRLVPATELIGGSCQRPSILAQAPTSLLSIACLAKQGTASS